MNGLLPFESTIEQTTETMPPSHKTITAAVMTTNRITSLRELLHYWGSSLKGNDQLWEESTEGGGGL